jgi:predicted TIM-barrel fold metal-dependent hydrolase
LNVIVDAQVHLWTAETPDRPWPPGGAARAHLPEPLTYQKMLPMMQEAGVDRVIIVPPSWEGDRIDYALEAARVHPDKFAVMGRIPLKDPQSAKLLPRWREQPGMLGIRVNFARNPAGIADGSIDWLWAAADAAGVPIMVHPPDVMPVIGRVADKHPGLRLIIDHMGLSSKIAEEKRIPAAIAETLRLARHPNVAVKVSAVPAYSSESYPFRDMDEHLRRLLEAFGPRRCFWGTDLTHSHGKCSYRQYVTHFTEELDFLSDDDKRWIMGDALLKYIGWK